MQPPEHVTGPVPPAAASGSGQPPAAQQPVSGGPPVLPPTGGVGAAVPPGPARKKRVRLWLAMALGLMILLCLGGVGVFVSLYDGATQIKRSAPDAVVDNFIRAYLDDRDDKEAALFSCKSGGEFSQLAILRSELVGREKNFGVKINVTWGALSLAGSGNDRRSVATDLIISGTSDGNILSRSIEKWTFVVVNQDGWRVCSAAKVA